MRKLVFEALDRRDLLTTFGPQPLSPLAPVEPAEVGPQAVVATRDLALWPFASSSPWNTSLGSGANYTGTNSPNFSPTGGANLNVTNWSMPVYVASPTDPVRNFYWADSNELIATIRAPDNATPDPQSDGHLNIIDPTQNVVVEMWQATRRPDGNWEASVTIQNDLNDQGVYDGYHGARAYGGSAIAGLIRRHELEQAEIPHALAIAVQPTALNRLAPGGEAWVWPASHSDGGNGSGYATSGNLYMGSLLAIPPSVNIDALGLGSQGRAVARALQDFGAYIVDSGGGNTIFYAESSAASVVQSNLRRDLDTITRYLQVVDNNSPDAIGGGGQRRRDPAPDPSAEPVETVSVFGIVTFEQMPGRPAFASRATVELYDGSGSFVAVKSTDTQGRYSFDDLLPDTYRIKVRAGGYQISEGLALIDEEQEIELKFTPYLLRYFQGL